MPDSVIPDSVVPDSTFACYAQFRCARFPQAILKCKYLTIWTTLHRVWDYPIREQYTHVLRVIEETGPVGREEEGFGKVLESESGDFAFIHDAARIR